MDGFWGLRKHEHDPKLKGTIQKRGRSRSPIHSPPDKRSKTVKTIDDRKSDVYYNNTIEQRFNKQEEQNHFLAKSLAGISAELKSLTSHQPQHPNHPSGSHPSQPAGNQDQVWSQAAHIQMPRQPQMNVVFPTSQNTMPYPTHHQPSPPVFNPYH